MKIDLHVHSKYSKRPSQWILQKIGCPESFTEPLEVYRIARKKGMSAVTITDHNTIDGALEIAHLPNTFISEEVTTYFPDNPCKFHVLTFNIDERQHKDIQKARPNIFDLVNYLQSEGIVHALAHPLYSINDLLTVEFFEKVLLLFKNLELNGCRDEIQNQTIQWIVSNLQDKDLDRLAKAYNIQPVSLQLRRKTLIGGSDDHSSLNIASTYTEVKDAATLDEFLDGIRTNKTRVIGKASTPLTLAHNLYGIAYQFYKNKLGLDQYVHKDMVMRLLDRFLAGQSEPAKIRSKFYYYWQRRKDRGAPDQDKGIQHVLRYETAKIVKKDPELMTILAKGNGNTTDVSEKWFQFVNRVSNRVSLQFANHLMDHLTGINLFNIFNSLGSAGSLYFLIAPYFISFSLFARDRQLSGQVKDRFSSKIPTSIEEGQRLNVAHFTDTFHEINGVALTLRQQLQSARRSSKQLTIITCGKENENPMTGVQSFKPIGTYALPLYPEIQLFYPPFLEMLNFCHERRFSLIHSATPGLIGLSALAISRILRIPLVGTYHTSLPQYASYLTQDRDVEELTWKYVLWYYEQMNLIFVPSKSTGQELVEKGISPEKICFYPRGINTERFHPAHQDPYFMRNYTKNNSFTLLYVGRVSKEKNLPLLVEVFQSLLQSSDEFSLIVVGDGPYLNEMKQELEGTPCSFTGYLSGEPLSTLYASCDLFVFPSTTDTFGNVVFEAQASGTPVVVTDTGGPCENILPGRTGLVVPADDKDALVRAILHLKNDPLKLKEMGKAARRYMEDKSFDAAFDATWEMYQKGYLHGMTEDFHMAEAV